MRRPSRTSEELLVAAAAFVLAAGCGPVGWFVAETATPQSPSPTPFSASALLQKSGEDAVAYASRYFSESADFSMDVPAGWVFNQQTDTGAEQDSFSEKYGAAPAGAIYTLEKIEKGLSARQAMESFLKTDAVAARRIDVGDQADFPPSAGPGGWKLTGTMRTKPEVDVRETCEFIAFVNGSAAYVLAAYPDRAAVPATFTLDFENAARSLRWEETRPKELDKSNMLQLAEKEPDTLDPARTLEGAGGIVGDVFSGLAALDENLQPRPDLAAGWDVTPDGRTYTFHLRANVTFHNGRPFTAEDVLFSWLRAAGPRLNSPTAMRFLGDILGMTEYHEGKTDAVAGLQLVDPQTIRVTLDGPKPFFLDKLANPAAWIVDRYNVRLPHWEVNPVGTGPFRMIQQLPDKNVILESNPEYYGSAPKVQYLFYWLTSRGEQPLYKSGKADRMHVAADQLPNVANPHDPLFGNVSVQHPMCTNFIMFNTAVPPFDDPLVRKAFSLAVNREVFAEVTQPSGDLPAGGLLPPGMPGYTADSAQSAFDPAEAKRLIQQSRYFDKSQAPTQIRFVLPSVFGEYDATMDYLITSWEQNLGVDIFVEGVSENVYLESVKDLRDDQLIFMRHCADFPDPENFYNYLFLGEYAGYYFGYRSAALDSILRSAAVESDWTERMNLYRQADRILLDDSPAMFLTYDGPVYVVWRPTVAGYTPARIDIAQHNLLWLQKE